MMYKRKTKSKTNNASEKVEPGGTWKKSGEIETARNMELSGNPVHAV